ncbi:MAG: DUF58 domain-containing protein [Candidatus Ancillula sp.]|jgi:uncharacterized protein (DUF58 family)|nr:DUF58 domain-containing protein [Candidatus Ancillula sp.]
MSFDSTNSLDDFHNFIKSRVGHFRLPIAKKTVGIIDGVHPSIFKGAGHDFEDFRSYEPGDNPRDIDWKSSAKNGKPVIKRYRADANTNMCMLIDSGNVLLTRSASGERKIDVLEFICETFGYLGSHRLDAIGMIAGDSEQILNERPRLGYGEVRTVIEKINKLANPTSPKPAFKRVLTYASTFFKKRTFLVLIFDETNFYDDKESKFALVRRLKERHDLFAVGLRSVNPFDTKLPNIKGKTIDINNQNFIPAYYRSKDIAKSVDKEMSRQRKSIRSFFKQQGIPLIGVAGTKDFVAKLNKILQRREVAHLR